jgi:uncharacterized protein (TIGR04255 family)
VPRRYREPPISEVVCEFRLPASSPWDLAVPGLLYERVRKEFPARRESTAVLNLKSQAGEETQIAAPSEQVRFYTEDEKTFVRVAPRMVGIHRLAPYESWEEFRPKIELVFGGLLDAVDTPAFARIGLRYINRISIPEKRIDIHEWFGFRPELDDPLPQDLRGFLVGVVLSFEDDRDQARVQLGDAVSEQSDEESTFLLDIDYALRQPDRVRPPETMSWLEQAHERVEELFEGCIKDRLRQRFVPLEESGVPHPG